MSHPTFVLLLSFIVVRNFVAENLVGTQTSNSAVAVTVLTIYDGVFYSIVIVLLISSIVEDTWRDW